MAIQWAPRDWPIYFNYGIHWQRWGEDAKAAKARHSADLLAIDDVVGHGVGINAAGEPVIEVYLGRRNAAARARISQSIEGIAVRVEVTGPFVAY